MKRSGNIARHSAAEVAALRRKRGSRTDWAKVDATSEAALEASIAADRDDVGTTLDWTKAVRGLPPRKQPIKLR